MRPTPTGKEILFDKDELIVSKTDKRGIITYANDVFVRVSRYTEEQLLGSPHNLLRHPEMPRCVFKLLWDVIPTGREIFAYINNLAKDGSNYWVFAHVTPSFDQQGNIVGYHSSRRVPYSDAMPKVKALYTELLAIEAQYANPKEGMAASEAKLKEILEEKNMDYDQFVFSLSSETNLDAS